MAIKQEILDEIQKGIKCPVCDKGYIYLIRNLGAVVLDKMFISYPDKLICNTCHKEVIIDYTENPFKIVNIRLRQ